MFSFIPPKKEINIIWIGPNVNNILKLIIKNNNQRNKHRYMKNFFHFSDNGVIIMVPIIVPTKDADAIITL